MVAETPAVVRGVRRRRGGRERPLPSSALKRAPRRHPTLFMPKKDREALEEHATARETTAEGTALKQTMAALRKALKIQRTADDADRPAQLQAKRRW